MWKYSKIVFVGWLICVLMLLAAIYAVIKRNLNLEMLFLSIGFVVLGIAMLTKMKKYFPIILALVVSFMVIDFSNYFVKSATDIWNYRSYALAIMGLGLAVQAFYSGEDIEKRLASIDEKLTKVTYPSTQIAELKDKTDQNMPSNHSSQTTTESSNTNIDTREKSSFEQLVYQQMQIPEGQILTLHSLWFADIFQLANFDLLRDGLDRLYDQASSNNTLRSTEQAGYRDFIANSKKAFLSSSWAPLGGFYSKTLKQRDKAFLGSIIELPEGIEKISFELHQILRSMIVVVTKIDYSDSVSRQLSDVISAQEEERVEKHDSYESHIPIQIVKAEKVSTFLTGLHKIAEKYQRNYFAGEFLSLTLNDTRYACPSMLLYSLNDIPFTSKQTLKEWLTKYFHFLEMLSYIPVPELTYQKGADTLLFSEQVNSEQENPKTAALMISETLLKENETVKGKYYLGLGNTMPIMAFSRLMFLHSQKLITHRQRLSDIDNMEHPGVDPEAIFESTYNAKLTIEKDFFGFTKTAQEIEEVTSSERGDWIFYDTPIFELMENPHGRPHFAKCLVEELLFLKNAAAGEYSLLRQRYSDLFLAADIRSNFEASKEDKRKSSRLLFLTYALVVVAVLTLVAILCQIHFDLYHNISK